ncbi:hypothetical protein SAMN05892883_2094 [Jatrophihabitans sp. GAS493]|uniref:hypothetical protein n=1 Tax=Jatrophihabitans sp. GAS493 TaxID=1907575 RepID=UPI000BB99415|nr:hypothetical protein [Jatrophihabitans sp. GAS493]SOD72748.1 hypothetical protein SAMN05892883_2094 [Jatrophihabitans sp. GAS493]
MSTLVVGADPGMTTGLFHFTVEDGTITHPVAIQIHGHEGVVPLVRCLISRREPGDGLLLAVEQFIVGGRAHRSSTPGAGKITRDLIGALLDLDTDAVVHPAGHVKPWATDRMLEAAGLLKPCDQMRHAKDAARHALFAAVAGGLVRNPLSKAAV